MRGVIICGEVGGRKRNSEFPVAVFSDHDNHLSGFAVLQEVEAIPVLISALGNYILNPDALVPSVPQTSSG